MSVQVRFFAGVREALQRPDDELEAREGLTVQGVWNAVSNDTPLPPSVLAAVNHEYVMLDHPVRDGDEVAFFPPVTGGSP